MPLKMHTGRALGIFPVPSLARFPFSGDGGIVAAAPRLGAKREAVCWVVG